MARKSLKRMIDDTLDAMFQEHGFSYDERFSRPRMGEFTYTRSDSDTFYEFESRPTSLETLKLWPKWEEIAIYRHRFAPEITVSIMSSFRPSPRETSLGYLAGETTEKWWRIHTQEEMQQAFEQIVEWLDKYAWRWFDEGRQNP